MPLTPQEQQELDTLELQELEEQEKAYQASLNPQQAPASAPEESFMDRIQDPERWKAVAGLPSTKRPEMVAGTPPLAMPASMAPAAIGKLAEFFGKAKTTAGTIQGGLEGAMAPADDLADRAKNAAIGSGVGLAIGATGALAGKGVDLAEGFGRAARMSPPQVGAYMDDPKGIHAMADAPDDPMKTPELQNQAVDAINASRKGLKAKGLGQAKDLRELLTGKTASVPASELDNVSPEIDRAMRTRTISPTEYVRPNNIDLPANEANAIKRELQRMSKYKPGTVIDPVQEAKAAEYGAKAAKVRQSIEGLDPKVAELNKSMQESTLLQEQLRKGAKQNPLAFLSSESPDRVASLARAEQAGGKGGMLDFGKKLGAAKSIASKDVDDALSRAAQKAVGRFGLRRTAAVDGATKAVTGPLTIDALMNLINEKRLK